MEGQEEMGFIGEHFDPNNFMGGEKEDSGSDNYDTVSVEDLPEGPSQNKNNKNKDKRRKRYHRHTPQQIQELEKYAHFLIFYALYFYFDIWADRDLELILEVLNFLGAL